MSALLEVARIELRRQTWRTLLYAALVNLPLLAALLRVASGETEAAIEARLYQHWYTEATTLGFSNVIAALVAMIAGVDLFAREWREGYGVLFRTLALRTRAIAAVRIAVALAALGAGVLSHVAVRALIAPVVLRFPLLPAPTTRVMLALWFYAVPFFLAGALIGQLVRAVPAWTAITVFWFVVPAWAAARHVWWWSLVNAGGVFEGVTNGSAWLWALWIGAAIGLWTAVLWRAERRQVV